MSLVENSKTHIDIKWTQCCEVFSASGNLSRRHMLLPEPLTTIRTAAVCETLVRSSHVGIQRNFQSVAVSRHWQMFEASVLPMSTPTVLLAAIFLSRSHQKAMVVRGFPFVSPNRGLPNLVSSILASPNSDITCILSDTPPLVTAANTAGNKVWKKVVNCNLPRNVAYSTLLDSTRGLGLLSRTLRVHQQGIALQRIQGIVSTSRAHSLALTSGGVSMFITRKK